MRKRTQSGQGIVEFAVIFPIFVFLVFAVIDGGLLMGRYNNMNNGAKEGARLGAVGAQQSDIVTRVEDQAHGNLDGASTNCGDWSSAAVKKVVCVEWITGADGQQPGDVGSSVRVKVKYDYPFLTPIINWIGDGWTIKTCAVQRLERPFDSPPNTSTDTSCDGGGAGGGSPTAASSSTPAATVTSSPIPTNTSAVPTPCPNGNPGHHCRETATAEARTETAVATLSATPVPPTATRTPVPTPTPCPAGWHLDDGRCKRDH